MAINDAYKYDKALALALEEYKACTETFPPILAT